MLVMMAIQAESVTLVPRHYLPESSKDFLAYRSPIVIDSGLVNHHCSVPWLTGTAMPLDPLAKRLLAMMAAAAPGARTRPSTHERRQSLTKLMQFARADAAELTRSDGTLPGPAGDIPY